MVWFPHVSILRPGNLPFFTVTILIQPYAFGLLDCPSPCSLEVSYSVLHALSADSYHGLSTVNLTLCWSRKPFRFRGWLGLQVFVIDCN